MARSFDIATFDPSDGILNEQLRRKLNGNFQRLCSLVGTESPVVVRGEVTQSVQEWARGWVAQYVDDYFSSHLQQVVDEAVSESFDSAYPVGCVVVTTTASDPRLSRGEWQQVGEGRYVRAAGGGVPVMSEGGSDEVTLTEANLPEHSQSASAASAGSHSHNVTVASGGSHSHSASTTSAGNHTHNLNVGWGGDGAINCLALSSGSNDEWNTTTFTQAYGAHTHSVTVNSGGAHAHSATIQSSGEHSHAISVSPSGSADPQPIPIEPEYLALLFYRRVQ